MNYIAAHKLMLNNVTIIRCAFLVILSIFTIHCGEKITLPSALSGTWKTEAEQYEDRFIEISTNTLTFGTGNDMPNVYFIRGIDHKRMDKTDEYTFKCVNSENIDFRFIFYFENDENSLLMRLKNPRQVIWIKKSEPVNS